jgi:arylsulfatase A-like enzyme
MEGIYVLTGGAFVARQQRETANIVDLAPTILHLLGVPVPECMDGHVLLEAIRSDYRFSGARPSPDGKTAADQASGTQAYSVEEETEVMGRLRELGYL